MRPSSIRHGDITEKCVCGPLVDIGHRSRTKENVYHLFIAQVTGEAKKLLELLNLIKTSNVRENVTMVQLVEGWRGVGPVYRDLKLALSKTAVDAYKAPKELGGQENLMKMVSCPLLSTMHKLAIVQKSSGVYCRNALRTKVEFAHQPM